MRRCFVVIILLFFCFTQVNAAYILISMDEKQKDHLKSYGVAYWVLDKDIDVHWLLNYRGGSFAFKHNVVFEKECKIRNVSYKVIPDAKFSQILTEIADPEINMDAIKLEKPPKIAVYSPKSKQPWDDAVTMVLAYAEIPYDVVYDEELMDGKLPLYDWLHLHHEDFTGQYGKFYKSYHTAPWYKEQVRTNEAIANKYEHKKVSKLKLAVAHKIRDFVAGGGFLFAMCSATDTYDIALAAEGTDICEHMYDGDKADSDMNKKLDFDKSFAFKDFNVVRDPFKYEYSNIDNSPINGRKMTETRDYFSLFEFSAKWDPIPTMLTQNHTQLVKGFMGQTTAFKKNILKSSSLILGENKAAGEARYIHGEYGEGTWTFYGGHDPEDYQHFVGDPKTDLSLHPNSPGYRLILNNILFPAAKKKKQKT